MAIILLLSFFLAGCTSVNSWTKELGIQQKGISSVAKNEVKFSWPIAKDRFWISSYFGNRKHPNGTVRLHKGIDMAALKGTPVMAAAPGTVSQVEAISGYGNMILLSHNNGYQTRYAHLDSWCVNKGQRVLQGQVIGHVGATGSVRKQGTDASHLHFEIHKNKKPINPFDFLQS